MNRARLFLSAVSSELRSSRQLVAATLRTLGYDPVSQDDFPTGHGELSRWLQEQLDSCEGLIQLVGDAYGAEPPAPFAEFGRASYTQFELLYAHARKKKVWVVMVGPQCHRDAPPERLDLPPVPTNPDADAAWQSERKALQAAWKERLTRENYLRHAPQTDADLQNTVLRLRDELGELRRQSERQTRRLTLLISLTLLMVILLGVGGGFAFVAARAESKQVTAAKIRAHLLEREEALYQAQRQEAEDVTDWRERERRRSAAESSRYARLARIDELANSFSQLESAGRPSPVLTEMTRVLAEQGVDEAILYAQQQQGDLLQRARARAASTRDQNRAELRPLLALAALEQTRGNSDQAYDMLLQLLEAEPDWPEAENAWIQFVHDRSGLWFEHASLSEVRARLDAALSGVPKLKLSERLARRTTAQFQLSLADVDLAQGDPEQATRGYAESLATFQALALEKDCALALERLGDVAMGSGQLEDAVARYTQGLTIARAEAKNAPDDAGAQRDLSVSLGKLAHVALAQRRFDDAAAGFRESLQISQRLVKPHDLRLRRDVAVSQSNLADVAIERGDFAEAARAQAEALSGFRALSVEDPTNVAFQRDVAVALGGLANASFAQDKWDDAATQLEESLTIYRKLSKADPENVELQRSVAASVTNLADVAERRGQLDDAVAKYTEGIALYRTLALGDDLRAAQESLAAVLRRQGKDAPDAGE